MSPRGVLSALSRRRQPPVARGAQSRTPFFSRQFLPSRVSHAVQPAAFARDSAPLSVAGAVQGVVHGGEGVGAQDERGRRGLRAALAGEHPAPERGAGRAARAARQVPQRAALALAHSPRASPGHRRHRLVLLQVSRMLARSPLYVSAACGRHLHVSIMLDCLWKARRKEREGEATGDPKLYLQEALLERKLPELDMRQLVDLPDGLDYNEWLASHTLALFDHVNLLYGTVSEFCTAATCPDMTGPGGRSYAWYDERGKKSRVAAPQYVDYVMTFTQKTVSDETVFPTKYANEFPAQFEATVRRVVRLQFHVVAHMYAAHFRQLALLRLHAHLHLTFAHLTALDTRFSLLDHKETEVLRDLEVALRLTESAGAGAGAGAGAQAGAGAGAGEAADDASPRRRSPVVTQPLATA